MNFQRTRQTSVLCRPNGALCTLFPIRFSEQLEQLADTFAQYHKRTNISFARDTEWFFFVDSLNYCWGGDSVLDGFIYLLQ